MKKFLGLFFLILGIATCAYSQTSEIKEPEAKAQVVIEDGIDDNGDLVKVEAAEARKKDEKEPGPIDE